MQIDDTPNDRQSTVGLTHRQTDRRTQHLPSRQDQSNHSSSFASDADPRLQAQTPSLPSASQPVTQNFQDQFSRLLMLASPGTQGLQNHEPLTQPSTQTDVSTTPAPPSRSAQPQPPNRSTTLPTRPAQDHGSDVSGALPHRAPIHQRSIAMDTSQPLNVHPTEQETPPADPIPSPRSRSRSPRADPYCTERELAQPLRSPSRSPDRRHSPRPAG